MSKIAVGIITYGESTAKYLPYFLESLAEQTCNDYKLLVYDNTDNASGDNRHILERSGMSYEYFTSKTNLGFGKAYNILIGHAINTGYDYFLLLNIDMIFDRLMIKNLLDSLEHNPKAGAVAPKILRWDFTNKQKTDFIDSYGLTVDKLFRFFDNYQGQIDREQIQDYQDIFGFTGAAALIRLKSLQAIAHNDEYFDELMFMYKEDCDLSLRLRLAGWQIAISPTAIAYHDRTAATPGKSLKQIIENRRTKSRKVKQWSFLNQLILVYKFSPILPPRIKFFAWSYQLASILFAGIFESYLLKELQVFFKIKSRIKAKSMAMPVNLSENEILGLIK